MFLRFSDCLPKAAETVNAKTTAFYFNIDLHKLPVY